jgi:hypothetical protein
LSKEVLLIYAISSNLLHYLLYCKQEKLENKDNFVNMIKSRDKKMLFLENFSKIENGGE